MAHTYNYANVAKALEELKALGFTIDFNLEHIQITENPTDFEIVHIYRYEGDTDPDDEATVYGIKSISNDRKGVYVTGFSANSGNDAARVLMDLTIKDRKH
ncbi:hypothetical protein [Flavobacterium sp.]|uniref:hypothetical protein n=1 Tax=Flavobacterium sp. TaxID=239 RepID=UPI003D6A867F